MDSTASLGLKDDYMDYLEKERLISKILYPDIFIDSKQIVLSPPNGRIKTESVYIYEKFYNQAIDLGLMDNDDLLYHLAVIGQWNPQELIDIETIKTDIERITKGLLSLIFNTSKLKMAKKMLREAENQLTEKISKKNRLLEPSANNYAVLKQQQFIISKIAKYNNGQMIWKNFDEFLDSDKDDMMADLLEHFFINSRIPQKTMRLIARTNPWRQMWLSFKNMGSIFDRSPCDWSDNQTNIVFWSKNYDLVYEAYERPSTDIIHDDDLLDSWFLNQTDKIESKCKNKLGDSMTNKSRKDGRQENFIITDRDGAKKVYNMNDPSIRSKIKARQKVLDKHGKVKEQHMPDSQQEIRQKALAETRNHINRGKKR